MTTKIEVLELQQALNIRRKEKVLAVSNYKIIDLEQIMDDLITRRLSNPPSLFNRVFSMFKLCIGVVMAERSISK